MEKYLSVLAALCVSAIAQPVPIWPIVNSYTVASMPAAGVKNRIAFVTDAASAASCTVGGGSVVLFCRDSGSAWAPAGDGAGGGLADPGSNGVMVRTALNTTTARTITGTANQITVTNGDGVSGAPTISIPTNPTLPGTTTGTFSGDLTGNASTATALSAAIPVNRIVFGDGTGVPSSESSLLWYAATDRLQIGTTVADEALSLTGNMHLFGNDLSTGNIRLGLDVGSTAKISIFNIQNAPDPATDTYNIYSNYSPQITMTGGTVYGIFNLVSATYSGAGNPIIAAKNQASKAGAGSVTFLTANDTVVSNSGTGSVGNAIGYYVDHAFTGNAVVSNAIGYQAILGFGGGAAGTSGSVTVYKGFEFKSPQITAGDGSIGTMYGFYAENVTGASTNYAIYTNLGAVRFGDNVTSTGSITAASFVGPLTGNASTATALAANPNDCSAGQYATTIVANGDLTCAQVAYSQVSSTPVIGTDTQAWDADLDTIGGLAKTDDNIIVANGTTWQLKALPNCSNGTTDKLLYNTSSNTFTCGTDQTSAGGGITSLEGQTGATQTFTDDTNVTIVSSADAHVITWAGTLAKARQNAATVYNDAANTWSTGAQDMSAATSLKVPIAAGAAPATNGLIAYDSTAHQFEGGVNGGNKVFAMTDGNIATASALAGNPADCSANQFATTIAANGDLACAAITDADVPNTITVDLAAAATALQTARTINGTSFDGTANITVTAAAGTLTGATLASGVTASSLTSFGTSPTIVTPTIASFTNATHDHTNAAGGGTLTLAGSAFANQGTTTQVLHGNAAGNPTWSAVSLTADVSGTLPAGNGGTGNAFFAVSGPATSTKTFTFPNASATVLTDNALVTVAQGGTGVGTITGVIKGNGTSAFTAATAGTDYTSPSSTESFTNKTLDAAGTGNTLTYIERKYLTAAGCANTTATAAFDTPTSAAATAVCIGTTTTTAFLVYADGSTQVSTVHHRLPDDWVSTSFGVKLTYSGSVSSTSTINWRVSTACVADGEDPTSPSYNATSTNSAAGPTTTPQLKTTSFTPAVTNCAAGEMMYLKIEKVTGDSYTGSGYLMAAELSYTRTQ